MSDIKLIQLSNYVRPKLEENKSKNWVLNGNQNCFYQYIIDRNNGSVTNSAVNRSFVDLIYGRGLAAKDAHMKPEQWASVMSVVKPKELRKIITDYQVFGEAAMQVVKTKDRKKIAAIYHIPKQNVVPSLETEEGDILTYWYCKDWKNTYKYTPKEFPVFGTTNSDIEMYVVKPYNVGGNYFGAPDYLAGLPYAEMEEEIANFCINSIKKGLSAGYIINIPDGQTMTPEEKDKLEEAIKAKLTGSPNALSFVLNFAGKDAEITIVPFPVNEQQHKQWEFLTNESRQQLLTAHKVVSPMLFGIKDNTGLGNNANELDEAEAQLMKRVIQPKQIVLLDALEEILSFNGVTLNLYFKPLTEPVQTPVQMSEQKKNTDLNVADFLLNLGEDIDTNEWEEIDARVQDSEPTITEMDFKFAFVPSNFPERDSKQDTSLFKIRYTYEGSLNPQRDFCRKMVGASKMYRKEDIDAAGKKAVNAGFGPEGANTYSIWLYKGGARCHHYWMRRIFIKKNNEQITSKKAREVLNELDPSLRKEANFEVNDPLVAKLPIDMPNEGFLKPRK